MTAIAIAEKHELIAQALTQHAHGLSLRQIAESIGITHGGLRKWLLTAPEQYKQAQVDGLVQRIIEADEKLEEATDAVSIARAREVCRYVRWDAERRLPQLFGQKQELHVTVPIQVVFGAELRTVAEVPNGAAHMPSETESKEK